MSLNLNCNFYLHIQSLSKYYLIYLYPTCTSCNLVKSNNEIDFKLYTDKNTIECVFRFELDKKVKLVFQQQEILMI